MKNNECWYKKVCTNSCTPDCVRFREMSYLIAHSKLPKLLQTPRELFPATEEDKKVFERLSKIKERIVEFVDKGKSLYLASEQTGTSKTSWAVKLLLKYFDSIWCGNGLRTRGIFIHVPTLLHELKDFDHKVDLEEIINCDLVVWDDIALTKLTEYEYSKLLMLIDNRLSNGRANIYTSNRESKDILSQYVGNVLASRIYNSSIVLKFNSKDCRGKS